MNKFMSRITAFYVQHILSPYRDMDKEMKGAIWLLILLLGVFTREFYNALPEAKSIESSLRIKINLKIE